MLLFLVLAAAEVQPQNGIDLPPATDRPGQIITAALIAISLIVPYAIARVKAKGPVSNSRSQPPVADSSTPRLDVTQGYLERYVADLVKRVEIAEAKCDDLQRQNAGLQVTCARFEVQLESVRDDFRESNAKVTFLEGQLRGRDHSD